MLCRFGLPPPHPPAPGCSSSHNILRGLHPSIQYFAEKSIKPNSNSCNLITLTIYFGISARCLGSIKQSK